MFSLNVDEIESLVAQSGTKRARLSREKVGFVLHSSNAEEIDAQTGNEVLSNVVEITGLLNPPRINDTAPWSTTGDFVEVRSLMRGADESHLERIILAPSGADGSRLVKRLEDNAILRIDHKGSSTLEIDARLSEIRARSSDLRDN